MMLDIKKLKHRETGAYPLTSAARSSHPSLPLTGISRDCNSPQRPISASPTSPSLGLRIPSFGASRYVPKHLRWEMALNSERCWLPGVSDIVWDWVVSRRAVRCARRKGIGCEGGVCDAIEDTEGSSRAYRAGRNEGGI
jgi:hypothetical protein